MLELEKALRKRCEDDTQYATLFAQWTFDKQLVGRALQSVPLVFPHYSLHDASHADTILRQMARVLGPRRIDRLSPTDLWLLLEAAYHHDLGMVVPDKTMREWWSDKKFDTFLDGLANHPDDEVRRAAELLDTRNKSRAQGETWPFDVHRALVLVMAEYARPRHPNQSRKYIDAPSLLDLQSPRTQLVPRRFWSLLGRICESHGFGFAETMKLPARESGFAMDDAHPRFIACMLRLGDLLDLDDGRFCPVLARTFGGLPPSSKTHEEKHHSIDEFLVDASEIRVLAECSSWDAFDVTEQWFSWLRDELRNQSVHWAEISPEADFGAVPSAGRIEVRLRGGYHTSPDGRRPRFDVDKGAMLEFVGGAGLYSDETACVAELLQNAVDATLLRVWGANRRKWQQLDKQRNHNALEELRKHLQKYPIDVRVERSKRLGEQNHWRVIIRDRGAGISVDDVQFLQCVGSSRKNPRRKDRMRGMPEWMKPSGCFGIGLQSVFLFTDRVVLRSRADDSMETIEIELVLRTGSKEPQILVRSVSGKQALTHPGTCVRFVLRELKIPERFRYDELDHETARVARDYDPLLHDELPILPSKVRDAVRAFATSAHSSVRLDGSVIERGTDRNKLNEQEHFFDANNGMELTLRAGERGGIRFLFRGRKTEERFSSTLLHGSADWHQGDASKILTINREKVRVEALQTVLHAVDRALLQVIPRYYEKVKGDPLRLQEYRCLTLAAEVSEHIRESGAIPRDDKWMGLQYRGSPVTLGEIVGADRIRLIEDPNWPANTHGRREPKIELSTDGRELTISNMQFEDWLWELLRDRYLVLQRAELAADPNHFDAWEFEWLALRERPDDIIANHHVLKVILQEAANPRTGTSRRTIPCPQQFHAMAFSSDVESKLGYFGRVYTRLSPRAIFPFRVESDGKLSLAGVEELIRWTYENQTKKAATERDVARAVLDLVQTAHAWLGEEWASRADYSIEELKRRLLKAYGPEVRPERPRNG
jgi:hypothetical protein